MGVLLHSLSVYEYKTHQKRKKNADNGTQTNVVCF